MDETDLLTRLATEDSRALQELIAIYYPILCRFAEKYLPDDSLAKDVVQETFIKFWYARQAFGSMNALKGYLFTSTKNGCLNLLRGRQREENRHREVLSGVPEAMDPVMTDIVHAESVALVYHVVRDMPKAMKEIFYLSYEEGLTVKQISVRLNMNLKTVKSHKYNAMVILRNKFRNNPSPLLAFLTMLLK